MRGKAIAFVERMIDFAAQFEAPVIIGSMQGRCRRSSHEAGRARATWQRALQARRARRGRRRAAALRTAQPLRDEPHQHARRRRAVPQRARHVGT